MTDERAAGPAPIDLPTLAAIIERMLAAPRASTRVIVGLAGAPGAGKSTFAAALSAELPGSVVLPMDGFHLPQAELVRLGRRERMGAPDTFDVEAFVTLLESLRSSTATVTAPGFDRTTEEPVPDAITLGREARIVIVEGNYLLLEEAGWHRVSPLLDLCVGVLLDEAVRRERLIARHVAFGKSPQAARAWALGPDDANARLIAPSLARADHLLGAQ